MDGIFTELSKSPTLHDSNCASAAGMRWMDTNNLVDPGRWLSG